MNTDDIFNGTRKQSVKDIRTVLLDLTPRERQVLRLVARGHSTKVVALRLGISPKTANVYRQRILLKMSATNFTQVVWMLGCAQMDESAGGKPN